MPKELTTINTGCYINENSAGLLEPFGKVCPLDLNSGLLAITTTTDGYTSQGHRLEIKNNNGQYDPMVLHTNSADMTGIFRLNVEAEQTWAVHYLGTPPEAFKFSLEEAEKDEWYRFSFCIGTATITEDRFRIYESYL